MVPDFFLMPASGVFAQYIGVGQGAALAPGTVQMWRGNWEKDYAGISRKSEALHHDDGKFKSPYAEVTVQTCGDLRAIRPLTEGQPSTEFTLQADLSPKSAIFRALGRSWTPP